MTHLSHEDFVLEYYGDDASADRGRHLEGCAECRKEMARLTDLLDRVTPAEVPEPPEDYEARVWDRLQWRLRGERPSRRKGWTSYARILAAAAVIAIAFAAGLLWNRRHDVTPDRAVTASEMASSAAQQGRDRILLVVVGDHFDRSERMLVELTNLTPGAETDISTEREHADELLASNRLYRRTALDRGDERMAALLDQLEPVLLQIARGPSQVSADELRSIQKRVESKGLVFKLRIVRAEVQAASKRHTQEPSI